MRKVVILPLSSSQLHRIVPDLTFLVLDPQKPLTTLLLGSKFPSKSLKSWEIHAVHWLSIPTTCESVSNVTSLSVEIVALACIASAVNARNLDVCCARLTVAVIMRPRLRRWVVVTLASIQSPAHDAAVSTVFHTYVPHPGALRLLRGLHALLA